jgi:hypothetical protein
MSASPPLRFLAIVLGGWAALRTAIIAPIWPVETAGAGAAVARGRPLAAPDPWREAEPGPEARPAAGEPRRSERAPLLAARTVRSRPRPFPPPPFPALAAARSAAPALRRSAVRPFPEPPGALPAEPGQVSATARRWSVSAWSFVRTGGSPALADRGLLGASQAGARLAFRLNRDASRPLALSFRLSSPLERAAGAEAALGLDWKPDRRLPVHLLAERRQALGREGRSAFAASLHGGVGDLPAGPFRIDAFAQAGIVGARSRDRFADGSLRLSLPLGGRVRFGAGAWAAAQPGLARLDLGPQAALRLPVAGRALTVSADWRMRVAGNAEPGSGPTLTLSSDF